MHTGVLAQGLNRSEHESDHSNPSITAVMNKESYASTPPYMPSGQGQGELLLLHFSNTQASQHPVK
jgi:hypothetical protein